MAQGKTYTTKICPSSKEASDALGDLTQQLNRNVTPDKGKITFTQFAKLFLEKYITTKKGNDHATNYTIESRIRNQLVPFIGHMKLKDINGEVVQDLINFCARNTCPLRLKLPSLIGILGFTGIRPSEYFALMKEKILFDECIIRVDFRYYMGVVKPIRQRSKGKPRPVAILPDLEPILKEWYLKVGASKWLFPGRYAFSCNMGL